MRISTAVVLFLVAFSLIPAKAGAQWISFGAKGGIPITLAPEYANESRRYTVGPAVEFRLPANFAVEVSALYQRTGYSYAYNLTSPVMIGDFSGQSSTAILVSQLTLSSLRVRANSWRFPVVGKYYFRSRGSRWQPFLGTGYAFETSWTHTEGTSIIDGVPMKYSSSYRTSTNVGAVAAAGVRLHAGRFAVLPEFRFTRWGGVGGISTPRNESAFLLGIQF